MRHGATRLAETTYFFPPKPLAELTSYTGVCLRSLRTLGRPIYGRIRPRSNIAESPGREKG